MRYRILIQKLSFLHRLLNSHQSSISVKVFHSLKDQGPGPLIVKQSKFLEEVYHTNVTESILLGETTCLKSIKKALRAADLDYVWSKVAQQTSLRALSRDISWPKLWDMARDRGIQGTRSLAMFLRILASPTSDNSKCPLCDSDISRVSPFADQIPPLSGLLLVKTTFFLWDQN